jgi:hypothetical protein
MTMFRDGESGSDGQESARVDNAGHGDPLWKMTVYRLASRTLEAGWGDARIMQRNPLTKAIAQQLYRALASIVKRQIRPKEG